MHAVDSMEISGYTVVATFPKGCAGYKSLENQAYRVRIEVQETITELPLPSDWNRPNHDLKIHRFSIAVYGLENLCGALALAISALLIQEYPTPREIKKRRERRNARFNEDREVDCPVRH